MLTGMIAVLMRVEGVMNDESVTGQRESAELITQLENSGEKTEKVAECLEINSTNSSNRRQVSLHRDFPVTCQAP